MHVCMGQGLVIGHEQRTHISHMEQGGMHMGQDHMDQELFMDLRFGINTHSRIAVVGPNGSGKSTLLKVSILFYVIMSYYCM
jgi:ATPase subunit of ABC transporter with duplicated ATPase domains